MNSSLALEKYDEIIALLNEAGQEIITRRNQADFRIYTKSDESLVTNVDFWANEFLISRMKELYPHDVFIGEESENKSYTPGSHRVWYIDPIDGTKAYTMGEPHFFILIGLVIDGQPEVGFCLKPMENLLIYTHDSEVRIISNGIELDIPEMGWKSPGELVLKHFSTTQKEYVAHHYHQKKAPYIHDIVSQLAPLFGKTNGYLGFRRTYFWDLVAPAAIMNKAGFMHAFFNLGGLSMLLNEGSYKCRSYYALPLDAPQALITWFEHQAKELIHDES